MSKGWKQGAGMVGCMLLLLFLAGCSAARGDAASGQLPVVATTGQICDTVRHIAGDQVYLDCLFGPGVDPHLYVPTEGDVSVLGDATIIFYNGLHLEAQFTRVMEELTNRGKTVVGVGDRLPHDQLLNWDSSAPYDPHIWNDPGLWRQVTVTIRDTLMEADPENAELYRANAEAYLAEIDATDQYVREQIARIPEKRRVMITAHDAFGYFARQYGMEVYGLQGISTESEAGTADVQALADLIVEREIPAIFVETTISPRTVEAVQAAVRAKGFNVEIGGSLFSDALDSPGKPGGTYTGMLRENATTIANALSR